jgi:hemolysin activation/secretion protein
VHGLLLVLALAAMTTAAAQAPVVPPTAAASVPAEERFDILEYVVEDNTVLSVLEIERAVYPHLGQGKSLRDVEAARKALEEAYQRIGHQTVFVDIPEQRVEHGVVRLRVVEGRVDRLRVLGARYFSLGQIRAAVPAFAAGTVPDFNAVQSQLAQVNRLPDRQVTPVLRQGAIPGTVEVDLNVKDRLPLHADIEINNRSSPFTTDTRLSATLRYDNLWQRQHSLGLTYQTSPEDRAEVDVLVATYLWRFADAPDVLSLFAVRSDSEVALVGSSTVLGRARLGGVRWIRPLPAGRSYFHSLNLGLDYKDFGQTNIAAGGGSVDVLAPITYVPLSLTYSGTLSGSDRSTQLSLSLSSAPRGIFGNNDAEFEGRRVLARAGYFAWKTDLSHEQGLGSRVSAFARAEGQFSGEPLIPNEQFSLGGADSVRGYRESELFGDRGWRATAEVRFHPLGRAVTPSRRSLYALVGADAGEVLIVDPQGPQFRHRSLAGVVIGVRWTWHGLRLAADVARALRDGAAGLTGPVTERDSHRWHLRLGYEY